MQIFRLAFLRFPSGTFFEFSIDFLSDRASFLSDLFCSRASFLSDLFCSHSDVKLAKIKRLKHSNKQGLIAESAVLLAREREVHGSNHGVVGCFCTHEEILI